MMSILHFVVCRNSDLRSKKYFYKSYMIHNFLHYVLKILSYCYVMIIGSLMFF